MVFPSLTYPPDIQFHVSLIARGVVRDFSNTADQIRGFLNTGAGHRSDQRRAGAQPGGFQRPKKSDVVDLREDGPAAADARTHRL